MSRIDDLIRELCPDGVPFLALGELLGFEQPGKYLVGSTDYDDSYGTPVLTAGQTFVLGRTNEVEGIYPASPENPVVIFDDFTTAFKWVDFPFKAKSSAMKMLTPRPGVSLRYVWFAMQTIRYATQEHARQWIGTYSRFKVPVPPLEVQLEIVRVLDLFQSLEAELEAELETRRRQYAYYRDLLLTFREAGGVRWIPMSDLGRFFGGLSGKSKADFTNGNARFVSYINVFRNIAVDLARDDYVRVGPDERQWQLQRGDVLFTASSETVDDVAMSSVITTSPEEPLYLNSFTIGFRPSGSPMLDAEFSKHLFRSGAMRKQLIATAAGVTRFNVSKSRLAKVQVPVPSPGEQRRIASRLDKFDALVNDLSAGLPAELAARRQQYAHYRDRLLTFPEAAA